jgi:hypothetical protein
MRLPFLLSVAILLSCLFFTVPVSAQESNVECEQGDGNSTKDRVGCLDTDGDGWSDPDANWTIAEGADVWSNDPLRWSDTDGDGHSDQLGDDFGDHCPSIYGKSKVKLRGCSDIDNDFIPDIYDDDADGDGIRNELERAASSGTILYDPFNPNSVPPDVDMDTIPDVLDDDNDNDGWPDDVEQDRGSDYLDGSETPFNMYLGMNTGFFYLGGLSFTTEYQVDEPEFSVSGVSEIVFEELVIPLLLIPIYLSLYWSRSQNYKRILRGIEQCFDLDQLAMLEQDINRDVKKRNIKVYHGLVLRNAIEERETFLGKEEPVFRKEEE